LDFQAEPQGGISFCRAGFFPGGVKAGEKTVVVALAVTQAPPPGIKGKARDQDEELPRFQSILPFDSGRFPDIKGPQVPGSGRRIDPVEQEFYPHNLGNIHFFFVGKGRFHEGGRINFPAGGEKKQYPLMIRPKMTFPDPGKGLYSLFPEHPRGKGLEEFSDFPPHYLFGHDPNLEPTMKQENRQSNPKGKIRTRASCFTAACCKSIFCLKFRFIPYLSGRKIGDFLQGISGNPKGVSRDALLL
jgi:hypothetical protein